MSSSHDRNHLDDLLDQSAPPIPTVTNSVTDEVLRLHVLTREAAERTGRHRRWSRPTIAGAIALLLVGGASTAVATGWRPPSWENPVDSSYTFTLPSGPTCTMLIGNVGGSDPESVQVIRDFYRDADYTKLLDDDAIAAQIQKIRLDKNTAIDAAGNEVPAGYGTKYYNADEEYKSAVNGILTDAAWTEIESEGLTGVDPNLTWEGIGTDCPESAQ
jgi:hypothetical protein